MTNIRVDLISTGIAGTPGTPGTPGAPTPTPGPTPGGAGGVGGAGGQSVEHTAVDSPVTVEQFPSPHMYSART